jgi:hypothetical protein
MAYPTPGGAYRRRTFRQMPPPVPRNELSRMLRSARPVRPHLPAPPKPPANPVAQAAGQQPTGDPYGPNAGFMNQAAAEVNAQIDPLLQEITQRYNQVAQQTSDRIGAAASDYAAGLGQEVGKTQGMYEPAIRTLKGTTEGVAGGILQAGEAGAGRLSGALTQAGLPVNAGGTDINLEGEGAGSSEAAYQLGRASIQALKQSEDAALRYVSALPGFAKLQGDYDTQTALAAVAARMADELAQTTAQAPQLYYQIYNDLQDRADKAAAAQADAEQSRQTLQERQAAAQAKAAAQAGDKAAAQAWKYANLLNKKYPGRVYVPQQQKDGSWQVVMLKAGAAKPGSPRQQTFKGTDGLTYILHPNGTATPAAGQSGPKRPKATATKPYRFQGTNGLTYQVGADGIARPIPGQSGPKPAGAKPAKPLGSPTGNRPRRNTRGVWTTADGRKLTPKGQRYWERRYQGGLTDGRGGLGPANSSDATSGSNAKIPPTLRRKKPTSKPTS